MNNLKKILFTLFIVTITICYSQEKIKLMENKEITILDLKSYDIDDISNITSSDDKIYINFTSDKSILSYDKNGHFLKENDISNDLAASIVINSVRTIKYDSYLYYFQVFNNLNFYMFDNMNNIIYNFDNEFNIKTKRKIFTEEQFEIENIKLSNQFYTPTYNSLLFLDKSSNQIYLLENGAYNIVIQCDYEIKNYYFDKRSQQIFIYNRNKKQIDIYTLRGIFIKTINTLDIVLKDSKLKKIISANEKEIIIQTTTGLFSYKFEFEEFALTTESYWKNINIPKIKNITNIFSINIKNRNKFIIQTENNIIMLKKSFF